MEIRLCRLIGTLKVLFIGVLCIIILPGLRSQTTIFFDPGKTYTNTDSRTEDFYGPIDISGCNSIHVTLDYSFSLDWTGSGNMESSDECNLCAGDPTNPSQTGCQSCWDFLWVRYIIDGTVVGGDLIGEAGTTNAEQSGTIDLSFCVNGESALDIEVYTQTWAMNESVTFSNITVTCRNDLPVATASPNPVCMGNSVQLDEISGNFSNWTWSGPNGYSSNVQAAVVTDFTSSDQGFFVVTADDANGCPFSDSVEVLMLSQPGFTVPPDVTVCEGLEVDIDTLINPSNPNLTYTYHDGVPPTTGNQLTGLVSFNNNTIISVVGTDTNNCTDTQYVNLSVINVPVAPPANSSGPYCEGEDILLSASPPILPFITYTWTGPNGYMATGPDQTIPNAVPSDQGLYELTATFMGCTSQSTTVFVEVTSLPAAPTVNDPTEVCFGDTLMLTAMGDPSANYIWSGPNGFGSADQSPIVSTSADFTHQGIYSVSASVKGCVGTPADLEVIVNDTPQIVFNIDDSINCPGDNNGAVSVMIPGGSPPFTYDWSEDQYDGLQVISGLDAGTYSLTVTDGNGCESGSSITIEDPPGIQLFCDQNQAVSNSGQMDGIGEVFINGGTATFNIEYDNGNGSDGIIMNAEPGITLITNLAEGTYTIIVTDANGCTENCSFVISQQSCGLTIDTIIQTDSILCFGDSSAVLEAFVSGGSGMYIYQWEYANGTAISDSSLAEGLSGGMYYLSVNDSNDSTCMASSNFYISQPFPLQISSCSAVKSASTPGSMDGIAEIRLSGGTPSYTLIISGTRIDTFHTSNDTLFIDSLPPGAYDVLLLDNNGCADSCTFTIQSANCDLSISLDTSYFSACPVDSSLVIETILNNATIHTLQIWNGDTLNVSRLSGQAPGSYTITLIDTMSGCMDMLIVDMPYNNQLSFDCQVFTLPTVIGGSNGVGGIIIDSIQSPYEVVITGHNYGNSQTNIIADTVRFNNLDSGWYIITVTDSFGCMDTCTFFMPDGGCEIFSIDSIIAIQPSCLTNGIGRIEVFASGGSGMYNYDWNIDSLDGQNAGNNLRPGVYNVTVTDLVLGCRVQGQRTLRPVERIDVGLDYSSFYCENDSVALNIDVLAGASPFYLSINGEIGIEFNTDTTFYLQRENPVIEITDSRGCSFQDSLLIRNTEVVENFLDTILCGNSSLTIGGELFDINRPSGTVRLENASQNGCDSIIKVNLSFQNIQFTYELIPPSCADASNSQIRILSVDGTNDFSLYINGQRRAISQLPFTVNDLEAGQYEVFIESSNACRSDIQMISIEEPQQVEVSIQAVSTIQPGDTVLLEGASNASITGISWMPGNSVICDSCLSTFAFPDMTTTYTLQITNEEGCTGQAMVSVIVSESKLQYYIPNTFTPNGDGLNDFFTVYGDETSGTIKSMQIFDRWGNLLNEKKQISVNVEESGWNGTSKGKELKPGVYVYSIEIINLHGEILNFAGTITLLK